MDAQEPTATFLKADEVDEGGGQDDAPRPAARPPLRRDMPLPAPKQPPPPAPPQPAQELGVPTDSLSLMQLKKLVTDMPRSESQPYAFVYEDSASFQEEIEEIFGYSVEERASLLKAKSTFVKRWEGLNDSTGCYDEGKLDWTAAKPETRTQFLEELSKDLSTDDDAKLLECLEPLLYLALGCWHETAGLDGTEHQDNHADEENSDSYALSKTQFKCIQDNLDEIGRLVDLSSISNALQSVCTRAGEEKDMQSSWVSITLMCLIVDYARRASNSQDNPDDSLRQTLLALRPRPLTFITNLLAEHRWSPTDAMPSSKILLCYWKLILLEFGGIKQIDEIKKILAEKPSTDTGSGLGLPITASPLDYHLFRQEITSKYPAFDPPPPLFPFEADQHSILPPLHDQPGKDGDDSRPSSSAGPTSINGTGSSIIHEPVHIATPLPSPPPSPVGPGGKGIKKQNYQTNQMFPFLYPPLDQDSSMLGGKGNTELQDALVGKRWEGSDIPTSILEAADLFANRMRATRAMKQLWQVRVKFMKYERNYAKLDDDDTITDDDITENMKTHDEMKKLTPDMRQRLEAVERFYVESLPRLPSTVIVILKVLLQAVTTLVTSPYIPNGAQNGVHPSERNQEGPKELNMNAQKAIENDNDSILLELDVLRSQEVMGKAVSGIVLLLLKWFRLSHVLKFECLSQLLMDSNYVQLVVKLFTHQELERVVTYKCERKSLNFFEFCRAHSRHTPIPPASTAESSPSDAVPPPINLHRRDTSGDAEEPPTSAALPHMGGVPPEVDELGQPTTDHPQAQITDYSWRTFFTSINHLRILQKIVKAKPHRQLIMVQFKYSNILKKWLKVPQHDVRLYTLKIIKGQVPYCHRKWRSSNMRVITAIYLHCRPELRDEWLAGIDVDAEVGEGAAQEQALRALTYWYNLVTYPAAMGEDDIKSTKKEIEEETPAGEEGTDTPAEGTRSNRQQALRREEQDWFLAELEKMDLAAASQSAAGDDRSLEDDQDIVEAGEELLESAGATGLRDGLENGNGQQYHIVQQQQQQPQSQHAPIQVHGEVVQAPPQQGQAQTQFQQQNSEREGYGQWRAEV